LFHDDALVFKPLLYAPKKFQVLDQSKEEPETETVVEKTPTKSTEPTVKNPALWGAGFTTFFLGTLWYSATVKANSATPTSLVPRMITTNETGIQAVDFLMHRLLPRTISQGLISTVGIPDILYESLRTTRLERIPTVFDLTKMVANPTPMPFTTVWSSASEFARSLRLTAFFGFATEDTIKRALSDSLLFSSVDAEKNARMFVQMRSTLAKRGATGLVSGFTAGFIPGLVVPGYSFVAGCLIPYNVAAILNSCSQSVSIIEQKAREVAPESTAKLWSHVDAFWEPKKLKYKTGGRVAFLSTLLGYGYLQYKGFKNLLGQK
jgi:hypothetical protein